MTSQSTRDDIVKRASTLWEPTSLTATRAAAVAAASGSADGESAATSTERPATTLTPTEEMRRAKKWAKRAAKRQAHRQERQAMLLRANIDESEANAPRIAGYSGLAIARGRWRGRVVGTTGYVTYDTNQNREPVALSGLATLASPRVARTGYVGGNDGVHYASSIYGPYSLASRTRRPSCNSLGHFATVPASGQHGDLTHGRSRGRGYVRRRRPSY